MTSVPMARETTSWVPRFLQLDLLDNRYPALHGIRVIAIVSVVQVHVTLFGGDAVTDLDPWWAGLSTAIFFGMDLFFVLSGFLIGSILLRSIEVSGSQQVRRFYLRRAFRTFPSYYVVLTFLHFLRLHFNDPPPRRTILFEYAYLTDYGSPWILHDLVMPWGWSLAVEEKFYLAVPFLFFILRRLRTDRARLTVLGAMWVSALAVRLATYLRTDETITSTLYFRSHARFDTLVAGIIMAYVQHRWREPITRWLEGKGARVTLGAVVWGCLVILLAPDMFGSKYSSLISVFNWGTVTSIMYFAVVPLAINRKDDFFPRFYSAHVFRQLATLGYGVYLVHLPVLWWVVIPLAHWVRARQGWSMGWPAALAILLALSFCFAYCLHLFIEKPFLRLRDRLAG